MIDLIDMKAYRYDGASRENCEEIEIPEDLRAQAQEYREKLMDEVAEVSDALMERYLEGEEISHEETVAALKTGRDRGARVPRHLRRRHPQPRHQPAAGRVRRGPAVAGQAGHDRPRRRRRSSRTSRRTWSPSSSRRSPTRTPGRVNLFRVYQGVLAARLAGAQLPRPREGAHRAAADAAGQGLRARGRVRPGRHRRRGEAEGDARGRRARREGHGVPAEAAADAAAGDGVRDRGEGEGRRGEDGPGAPAPPGGGPDDRLPPRLARPASRSWPGSRRSTSR